MNYINTVDRTLLSRWLSIHSPSVFQIEHVFIFVGGHTSEMLRLMGSLSSCYQPRIYIVAETDKMSEDKINSFEKSKKKEDEDKSGVHVNTSP